MKRVALFSVSVMMVWFPSPPNVMAQEHSAEAAPAEQPDSVDEEHVLIPERQIRFEQQVEAHSLALFRADPKLLEQKYIAWVRLVYPEQSRPRATEFLPESLGRLTYFHGRSILFVGGRTRTSDAEYFPQLIGNVPEVHLPSEDVVSFFTTESNEGYLEFRGPMPSPADESQSLFEFRILAPNVDRAKELATALLTLYDQGFSRPSLLHIADLRRAEQVQLVEHEKAVDLARRQHEELQTQLESSAKISREQTDDLKTQQYLLAVDMAGADARVKAAKRILGKRESLSESRIEQVENIMIAAEIELAGLAARKNMLAAIIEKGEKRAALAANVLGAKDSLFKQQNDLSRSQKRIAYYEQATRQLAPFPLHEGKVVIQPIAWGRAG